MKIAALVPFKNEGDRLASYMQNILPFCDYIVGFDDGSVDNSVEIFEKFGGLLVHSKTNHDFLNYGEHAIRTELLNFARNMGATHFLVLDCDESLNRDYIRHFRTEVSDLNPGQSLSFNWIQLYEDDAHFIDSGIWRPTFKPFAFRDSETASYPLAPNHFSRVPLEQSASPPKQSAHGVVLHSQFLPIDLFHLKQCLYRMKELILSESSARGINRKYNVTKLEKVYISQLPALWNPAFKLSVPEVNHEDSFFFYEILSLIQQYGLVKFEKLDIWYHSSMESLWKDSFHRNPKVAKAEGLTWLLAKAFWHFNQWKG